MGDLGHIKLNRKIYNDPWWTLVRIAAWGDLIQMANWQAGSRRVNEYDVPLKRGQFCASVRFLARRWEWHPRRVQTFLDRLKKDGRIAVHTSGHWAVHRPTVYTIVKYDTYQSAGGETGTQIGTHSGTNAIAVKQLKQRATTSRDEKPHASTWLTPYCEVWDTTNGTGTHKTVAGVMARALRALHVEYGPELVTKHLKNYLKRTEPDYVSLQRFASTFAQWSSALTPEQTREVEEIKRMFADPTVRHE